MPSLTRAEAVGRSSGLHVRSYHVDLDLTTGADTFRSRTRITFDATGLPTFLDLKPHRVHTIRLNGEAIDAGTLREGRLPIQPRTGRNAIDVDADMRYSRECEGLHRYVDPADGKVYVYAFVYVDNAPRVFACFDQPDLKAPYTFALRTPTDWQVMGTSSAVRTGPERWLLTESTPQATYLTTVVAGPYRSFRVEHGGVRLGLHCRDSLGDALTHDLDELVDVTRQCLDAYRDLFGVPYPYAKLDQVFAPEFSVLSLDHPACILLREQYLFRSTATDSERETRAVVLAHGISLMWMAGLVTSGWWDDLWLGQAFADYMAHRITSEATRFPGPPTTFAARRKGQAYVADQRPSTHPVAIDGADVQSALLDLDRISYFKGHSVIRQLATRLGDDALRAGLRRYFADHAHGTAGFADFLSALTAATGQDLEDWAQRWFRTANVTTLEPEIEVVDGRIVRAAVRQSAPRSHPTLRPHTLDIGLYDGAGGGHRVRVQVDGPLTALPQLVGEAAPRFLLLNDGDLSYAKIRFDPTSLASLPGILPTLEPINRAMVWCNLLLAVQDGAFPADAHLDLVTRMVAVETELSILAEVLEQARNDVADRFLDPVRRPAAMRAVAAALRHRLATLAPGDERQVTLFRALVDFSADPTELQGWLDGTDTPVGLPVEADLAWRIRYRLAVLGRLDTNDIDHALRTDPRGDSTAAAARCHAARPDSAAKASAWRTITRDSSVSSYRLWALAEGFWQPEQADLTAPYVPRFFVEAPGLARLRGDLVLDLLLRFLYPRHAARTETLTAAADLLAREELPVPLRRRMADFTDDLRRAARARTVSANSTVAWGR
ncbi:aminopeptidase N [Salinispora arenicola]|uniref:aminopeptidase N n=1 Tax=Salinispora arenicola TaxID=168697 RepID=UPI0003A0AE18|nr:aminopeptidase N [Salinispora arenicola]